MMGWIMDDTPMPEHTREVTVVLTVNDDGQLSPSDLREAIGAAISEYFFPQAIPKYTTTESRTGVTYTFERGVEED